MTVVTEQLDSDFRMLKQARGVHTGRAWLVSDEVQKALSVRRLSAAADPEFLSFFAPDFALSHPTPWLLGDETDVEALPARGLPRLVHRAEPSSADFERHHEEILSQISRDTFQKVVPIVCEDLEFAAPLEAAMFQTPHKPGRFAYGFEFEGEGMSGLTPEVLFEVRDGILTTMALAGTAPADGPRLLDDKKETHEHELVIEHITTELKELGQISVGKTGERTYGKLKHLLTPIEVDLDRHPEFMELVVKLHPTAALGGWPRKPAVEWLEKQPFHVARKRFGAPFGIQDGDHMLCVVAIRGVQWWGTRARISVGCGVVKESQPLREWSELQLKRDSIYQAFGVEL